MEARRTEVISTRPLQRSVTVADIGTVARAWTGPGASLPRAETGAGWRTERENRGPGATVVGVSAGRNALAGY